MRLQYAALCIIQDTGGGAPGNQELYGEEKEKLKKVKAKEVTRRAHRALEYI